jgi:hypothetical protein
MPKTVRRKIKKYSSDEIFFFGTDPKKATKVRIDGVVYKQIGCGYNQCFASEFTNQFVRMRNNWQQVWDVKPQIDPKDGRLYARLADDNGTHRMCQSLKFTALAWNTFQGDRPTHVADLRGDYEVHHLNGNSSDNSAGNGDIIPRDQHNAITVISAETSAALSLANTLPCRCLITDGETTINKHYESRKAAGDDLGFAKGSIKRLINEKRYTTIRKGIHSGKTAKFENDLQPDLPDEIWEEVPYTLLGKTVPQKKAYVSNKSRYQNSKGKRRTFAGAYRKRVAIGGNNFYYHRVACLVFNFEAMNAYIASKLELGEVWTFATLDCDHQDYNPRNNDASNLLMMTHQDNMARSLGRSCSVWKTESGEVTAIGYNSIKTAADGIGFSDKTLVKLLDGKYIQNKKYSGRYI